MSNEYCYPGTKVLVNHLDIRDQAALDQAERYYTAYRAIEYRLDPAKQQQFDYDGLKAIHHQLFQDIYQFAGQIRTVNIGKNNFWFCQKVMMPRLADQIFQELKQENYLQNVTQKQAFAERAAYYYTEINYLHPFREGNGRAIREYFGQIAKGAGYELNWQEVPKEEYFQAVKLTDDPQMRHELVRVFEKCLKPIVEQTQQQIQWRTPERAMKLRDVLKITEGLPGVQSGLEVHDLNRYVEQFRFENKSQTLHVKMRGDETTRNIPMDKHPYLSAARKNEMLDIAAAAPGQHILLHKAMELGG